MVFGKIFARLIYKHVSLGIDTGYASIADVPEKYKDYTRQAYKALYFADCPEK